MNTQELKCFIVAADRLNFTRAAQELYVTTPTITHHIQKLEQELGVQLFIRDSKSVRLTAAGEIFYHDAHDILLRIERIPARLETAKKREQTLLRIGCTMWHDTEWIVKILNAFRQEMPDVSPRIYLDDYFQIMSRLTENQLDLAFGTKTMLTGVDGCRFRQLYTGHSKAVFLRGMIPGAQEKIPLYELEAYPLVVLGQKNVPKMKDDKVERMLVSRPGEYNVIRQDDVEAVLALAQSGYGVGILPEYAFGKEDILSNVQVCDIADSAPIEYGLIYAAGQKNPMIKRFMDCALHLASK